MRQQKYRNLDECMCRTYLLKKKKKNNPKITLIRNHMSVSCSLKQQLKERKKSIHT